MSTGGCKEPGPAHVAELAEITSGSVDKRLAGGAWGKAKVGDRFSDGDAIKTPADGRARIALVDAGGFKVGPRTLVHFGNGAIEQLEGQVEAEGSDLSFGDAVIKKGSGITVSRDAEGNLVVDVMFGTVSLTRGGETVVYGKNEQFGLEVDVGQARIRRPADAGPQSAPIDAGTPAAAPVTPPSGAVSAVVKGRGARVRAGAAGAWDKLSPGDHELSAGSEVSLREHSSIELTRGSERAVVDGAAELAIGGPGGPLLSQRGGKAQIDARASDTSVGVPGGTVIARAGRGSGSSASVMVGRGKSEVRARAGVIDVVGEKGGKETIQIGEWIELSRTGTIEIFDRPPAFAHFELSAGVSATVHDPSAPTNVRFAFGDGCTGAGIVELATGSFSSARISRGSGSAIMRIKPGNYRYRVRCLAGGELGAAAVSSGRIRINRDAGTKPLPTRPPANTVDADGRVWNVLYQNLLPRIGFQWPAAPASGQFTLTIQSENGKTEAIRTQKRPHFVAAGKLAEGTYRYWFADDAGSRSKETTLRIAFDNAAVSGYIRAPKVRERWSGGSVRVEGATVKGGNVSVAGESLALDSQYRFSSMVPVAADQRAIAIKFTHPKSGTHYYVRRNGTN